MFFSGKCKSKTTRYQKDNIMTFYQRKTDEN